MKSFDALFAELRTKVVNNEVESGTVRQIEAGLPALGEKITAGAARVWMAAEHETEERTAEEVAQLLYQVQVLMLAKGVSLADVYENL